MRLNDHLKKDITTIIIHASLLTYGDAFWRIDKEEQGVSINWAVIADGGEMADNGECVDINADFYEIVDFLFLCNFPDNEDETSSICWGLQFGTLDGIEIMSIPDGFWDKEVLKDIVGQLEENLKDKESLIGLKDIADF